MGEAPALMLATPCFGGKVTEGYCMSLHNLAVHLGQRPISYELRFVSNEALITRARNNVFAYFLSRPRLTHLMFIDADISFPPEAVTELLEMGQDLCGCVYPRKRILWENIVEQIRGGSDLSEESMRDAGRGLVVDWKKGEQADRGSKVAEVDSIGTGFMLISRNCAERMRDSYRSTLAYRNDIRSYNKQIDPENLVAVFDTMIDPANSRYLSEDYAFCRRWRAIGGRIFANLGPRLGHTGTMTY